MSVELPAQGLHNSELPDPGDDFLPTPPIFWVILERIAVVISAVVLCYAGVMMMLGWFHFGLAVCASSFLLGVIAFRLVGIDHTLKTKE